MAAEVSERKMVEDALASAAMARHPPRLPVPYDGRVAESGHAFASAVGASARKAYVEGTGEGENGEEEKGAAWYEAAAAEQDALCGQRLNEAAREAAAREAARKIVEDAVDGDRDGDRDE